MLFEEAIYLYRVCVFNNLCYRYLSKIVSLKSSHSPRDGSLIKKLLKVFTTRGISIHLRQTKFTFDLLSYRGTISQEK